MPIVSHEDMDSAMMSMLAMNQNGNQESINLGYTAITKRQVEERKQSEKDENDDEYQVHMSGMQEKNFDNLDSLMEMRRR